MFKTVLVLLFLVAAVFADEVAYFAFVTQGTDTEFVFKLTNDIRIKEARDMLEGNSESQIVIGRIIKKSAPYNPNYSFHLESDSIAFSPQAIEICDASLPYVENNLDEVCGPLLPGCIYCPWTTKLTREVKVKYYWKK